MIRIILIAGLVLGTVSLRAQMTVGEVLQRVDQSNATLEAQRRLTAARKDEARTGNSLPDPTVSLETLWGGTGGQNNSELTVAQSFDFPSVYAARGKIARLRASQLDNEELTVRQQVLLEAELLCIDLAYLQRQQLLLDERTTMAQKLDEAWSRRAATGDATAIDINKVATELAAARTAAAMNRTAMQGVCQRLAVMADLSVDALVGLDYPSVEGLPPFDEIAQRFAAQDPELKQLERQNDLSGKQLALQKGLALPRFELGYRHDFGIDGRFKGFVAGMSLPLFESRNRVRAARAQQAYAAVALDGARRTRAAQLRQLYDEAQLLDRSSKELPSPDVVDNSIAVLNKALDAGTLSVINYFTEMGSYFETRNLRLQLERDYHAAAARLFRFAL